MNNLLSKIAVNIKNLGKAKLDFSHSFSTTASFGDLQPIHCKIVQPNSNGRIEGKALVRLSTLLAPTFGKVKAKEYHHFVPLSDLFECIAPMLAQSKYSADGSGVVACNHFPRMTLGLLSRMILIGARIEIFQHSLNTTENHSKYITVPKNSLSLGNIINVAQQNGLVSWNQDATFNDSDWFKFNADNPNVNGTTTNRVSAFDGFHGTWFNLGKLNMSWFTQLGSTRYTPPDRLTENPDFWIPIANNDGKSLFGCLKEEYTDTDGTVKERDVFKHINFEKCDGCVDFKAGNNEYTLAFYLSSFGKRIRKQIIGSGKQINMCSYTSHEIVTLCAIWKAYFDLFAITQFENYEITPLRVFTRFVDCYLYDYSQSSGVIDPNIDSMAYDERFVNFIMALGRMWYTEPQSAVGAMLTSTAVSPSLGLSKEFIDVDGISHITEVNSNSSGNPIGLNGHAFIDAIKHGQLDANYLQKLYKWTNIHSVVGQAIEERLRAEGLGKYVRSCKSNFISFSEELIDISDVVSTSDTYNNASGDGKMLGSQGGRGIKLYKTKDASYSTDEVGVCIGLLTIVPEADFLRSIDPQSYTIKKTDFILPEFDGLGFEAMRKTLLNGAIDWASQLAVDMANDEDSMESVVGLLPRGTHLKLAHALNNGDITLRSTIDGYLPYTLDKYMKVGDYEGHKDFDNGNYEKWTLYPTMRPADVPIGGYHYRFTCRFPWLGNFNRIFANNPDLLEVFFFYAYAINAQSTQLGFELTHAEFDNFIVHGLVTAPVWSPCKPISESFETTLEGEKPNASFEHA